MNSTVHSYKIKAPASRILSGSTDYGTCFSTVDWKLDFNSTVFGSTEDLSFQNKQETQRVKDLKILQDNWDNDGARAIHEKSIESALQLIEDLNINDIDVYFTAPGPNGEVMVHVKEGRSEIEFILYSDKARFVQFKDNKLVAQGSYSQDKLDNLVNWLRSE